MTAARAMGWWCAGVMLFGLVLAAGAVPGVDGPAWGLLTLFGGHAPAITPELRFAVGLMGAVSLGWGASLFAVARTSDALAPDVRVILWRRIGWAVLAWFLVDSAISVATGLWPNAVSNTVLAGVFVVIVRRM